MEYRMLNVEGMYSVYFIKIMSKAKPPFEILRFRILRFCGSLFGHAESHTRCPAYALTSYGVASRCRAFATT